MASPGSAALAAGLLSLLASNGENLTLKRKDLSSVPNLRGLVNRTGEERRPIGPKVAALGDSIIAMATNVASPMPTQGESLIDESGLIHRIQRIRPLGHVNLYYCRTAEAA